MPEPDGFLAFDAKGRVLTRGPMAYRDFTSTDPDVIGMPPQVHGAVVEFVPEDHVLVRRVAGYGDQAVVVAGGGEVVVREGELWHMPADVAQEHHEHPSWPGWQITEHKATKQRVEPPAREVPPRDASTAQEQKDAG